MVLRCVCRCGSLRVVVRRWRVCHDGPHRSAMDARGCAITRVLLRAGFLPDGLLLCGRDRLRRARLRVAVERAVGLELHPYRHGGTGHLVPFAAALRCGWLWQRHCGWLDRNVEQPSGSCKLARWSDAASLIRTAQWSVRRDRHLVPVRSVLRCGRRGRRTSCFDRPGGRCRDLERGHQRVHGQSGLRGMHNGGAMLGERSRVLHGEEWGTRSRDNRLSVAGCELPFDRLLRDGHWRTACGRRGGWVTQSPTLHKTWEMDGAAGHSNARGMRTILRSVDRYSADGRQTLGGGSERRLAEGSQSRGILWCSLLVAGRNTPMADPDRRTPLLESYENAAVIVSGITAEQVTLRTPCPGYDVAGLIDHTVEAAYRAAALGRGRTPPAGDNSPHVELADAPAQLRRAAEEAAQAWGDDSRLTSSFTMPWGEEYSGATLVNMYLAELAAHAWDLALATEQLDRLDPSLAVSALDGARAMIQPEYRDMLATGSPSGRRFRHLLMPTTGNALPPLWDATRGHRSTGSPAKRSNSRRISGRHGESRPASDLIFCSADCALSGGASV